MGFSGRTAIPPPDYSVPLPPLEPTGRIWRRDLALNAWVWANFVVVFALLAISVAAIPVLWPSTFDRGLLWPFAALLAVVSAGAHFTGPPRIGSLRNHATVLCPPILTTVGIVVFAPHGVVPVAAAAFGGTFAASRIDNRRNLALHLLTGAGILLLPLALVDLDGTATMAILAMVPTTVALGVVTALVLEAVETQGAELERLVRRDALTGVGNRRLLDERLAYELERHERTRASLTLLALDLNGFKEYNAALGRDAGDRLLQRVAEALEASVPAKATVVRTGGDEFRILLPNTSWDTADTLLFELRMKVVSAAGDGPPVTTGIGMAVFPSDARDPELLVEIADTRLSLEKSEMRAAREQPDVWEPTIVPAPILESETTEPKLDTIGGFTQVSRKAIAINPAVWRVTGVMFAIYTVLIAGSFVLFSWPGLPGVAFCVAMALVAATILLREPPTMESWLNQLVVATPYAGSLLYAVIAPDLVGGIIGPIAFAGPLIAVRLVDRRQILGHFGVATGLIVAFFLTSVAPVSIALVAVPVGLSLLLTAVVIWSVGLSDMLHLECSDAQCEELDQLVRRDPITGLGNRRFYAEQLDHELRRSGRTRRPFSLLAVDLDEFGTVDERKGPGASEDLLRQVASALADVIADRGTLARRGGDQFCVILADTSAEQAVPVANALRVAVAKLGTTADPVAAGVGVATYPTDAADTEVLRHVAEWRVREDKQRRRGLPGGRRASDPPLPVADPAVSAEALQVFGRPAEIDGRAFKRRGIRRRSA